MITALGIDLDSCEREEKEDEEAITESLSQRDDVPREPSKRDAFALVHWNAD